MTPAQRIAYEQSIQNKIRETKITPSLIQKFNDYLDKNLMKDQCWFWKGPKNHHGYGKFYFAWEEYFAHRISYEIFKGFLYVDQVVRHQCNNKNCVNPNHLILGTQSDNIIDEVKNNRGSKSKLTVEIVKEIKFELQNNYVKGLGSKLSRKYNVNRRTISAIKCGKTWQFVKI